jgi:hypothetical protein
MENSEYFEPLLTYLKRVPAVSANIGSGKFESGNWWVKFSLDISHSLAWAVVQEFGHVLNYLSLNEPLPTIFKPVSPPPYMNGGPEHFLSWVIESSDPSFSPASASEWLEGRLPRPVENLAEWESDDDEA